MKNPSRFVLSTVSTLALLGLTACEERVNGSLSILDEGADHVLVRDSDGATRKLYAGKTAFLIDSSGDLTIENQGREIEIEIPEDLMGRLSSGVFHFDWPRARTGQQHDLVGRTLSEDRSRSRRVENESCSIRHCRHHPRRGTSCSVRSGWRTVETVETRVIQEVSVGFLSLPTPAPVAEFSGKRRWSEDVQRHILTPCR